MDFEVMGAKHGQVAADLHREGKLSTTEDVSRWMEDRLKQMGGIADTAKESWIKGFNETFDSLTQDKTRNVHYIAGFYDGSRDMRHNPIKDMYENRTQRLSEAGKAMSAADYAKYHDGYSDAMVQHIKGLGASQAAYDRGRGHTEGLLKGHVNLVKKQFVDSHLEAFEAGYSQELKLDREPLKIDPRVAAVTPDTIKTRVKASHLKMQSHRATQKAVHSAAYQDGHANAAYTIEHDGIELAQGCLATMQARLKNTMKPYELKGYMQGYADCVQTAVKDLGNGTSTKIQSPAVGTRFEVKAPAKRKDHALGM